MCFPSMIIMQLLTSNSSTFSYLWVKPGLEIFFYFIFGSILSTRFENQQGQSLVSILIFLSRFLSLTR